MKLEVPKRCVTTGPRPVKCCDFSKRSSIEYFELSLASFELRALSFKIFRNKNIFRNIFRLFCSWEQYSRNGNPGIPE